MLFRLFSCGSSAHGHQACSLQIPGVLPPSPFHFLPLCPPPNHQAQNLIPGQMCCSGGQARESISCVCAKVLHHLMISARKLSSSLAGSALLGGGGGGLTEAQPSLAAQKLLHIGGAGMSPHRSPTSVDVVGESLASRRKRPAPSPDQAGGGWGGGPGVCRQGRLLMWVRIRSRNVLLRRSPCTMRTSCERGREL